MTLVEKTVAGFDDGGDDAGFGVYAPHRADAAVAFGYLADFERELGSGGECVTTQVHGRRTRVRGLTDETDGMTFHAIRAEHSSHREVLLFQDGTLFDVEFEIRFGVLELMFGIERAVNVDAD